MQLITKLKQAKHLKTIVAISFLSVSLLAWLGIKIHDYYYVTTDDAYVNANVVHIAPRVSGKVIKTLVTDNTYVKAGQLLFQLDQMPFNISMAKAEAQLSINRAALVNAQAKANRTNRLAQKQFVSPQDRDNVQTNLETAASSVKLAEANLEQAKLNQSWANIIAPNSGWVSNLHLRSGDMVNANQSLFALICDDEFWIDANFKETQLVTIKPGQRAIVKVDMYPEHTFRGIVESISGSTGTAFSLLPPQNATGNWVKVTQRVPVRVRITNPDHNYPLRIGTSATVTISLQEYDR